MCDTMNDALIFMGKIPQNNAKNKLICENVIAWAISMAVLLPFAHRFYPPPPKHTPDHMLPFTKPSICFICQ